MNPGQSERQQTARILSSPIFANSPRMSRFLSFIVEETLAGHADRIKESVIGIEVFGKDAGYDPRADATVRTEAAKLRAKLQKYYDADGRSDPIVISIPKGSYVPIFVPVGTTTVPRPRRFAVAAALLLLIVAAAAMIAFRSVHARHSPTVEAFRLCKKGEGYAVTTAAADLQHAIQYFNLALAADPQYALAHADLSLAYSRLAEAETAPATELLPQAAMHANEALRLDPRLAESHHAMAWSLLLSSYDWDGAEREFRRALAIDPAYQDARYNLAHLCLNPRGKYESAAAELREGLKRDPISCMMAVELALSELRRGLVDEAIARIREALASFPESPGALTNLAVALQAKSQFDEALVHLLHARRRLPESAWIASHLAACYARMGKMREAAEIRAALSAGNETHAVPEYSVATVYAALGDKDVAFEHLEHALNRRAAQVLWMKVDPRLEPLRTDPRMQQLLSRIRLTPQPPAPIAMR